MRGAALVVIVLPLLGSNATAQTNSPFYNCVIKFTAETAVNEAKTNFTEIARAGIAMCENALSNEIRTDESRVLDLVKHDKGPTKPSAIDIRIYLQALRSEKIEYALNRAIYELISKKAKP